MNSALPIVVVAYNRPACLKRLVDSITNARYSTKDIPFIISIDKTDVQEVYDIAEQCIWQHGEKTIIKREEHLGLKSHILLCGDLTAQYENVIVLEDDLIVSPYFYDYALQALAFFNEEKEIAGISLFNYQVAENEFFPFYPVADGYDNYFIQVASSWGQIFFRQSWSAFRDWLKSNDRETLPTHLPNYLQQWSTFSWKKHLNHFLIETNQYFVFPRIGLSTNFGEPGVNTDRRGLFQIQLLEGEKKFLFSRLNESKAIYDAWFEIKPGALNKLSPKLATYDYAVDLHATKNLTQLKNEFLLSSKKCNNPVFSFANDMQSAEDNVIHNIPGSYYSLAPKSVFEQNDSIDIANHYVALNSIRDVAFHSFINEIEIKERTKADARIVEMGTELGDKMKNFVADFELKQQFPLLQVSIFHEGYNEKIEQTLISISGQQYPASQLLIRIVATAQTVVSSKFNNLKFIGQGAFVSSINESGAQYYVVVNSGEEFATDAFSSINTIFQKYQDVSWLTGAPANGINAHRWSGHIFELSRAKDSNRKISAPTTFWKKHVWGNAKPDISSGGVSINDLWRSFFKVQQLSTYIISSEASKDYQLLETDPVNKLYEYFFLHNTNYLRDIYRKKNALLPIIRFNSHSQSYFLSDY